MTNHSTTIRLLNAGLILAFSICLMEWADKSAFVFQTEYQIFAEGENLLSSLTHPLILAGLIGQLLLLYVVIKPGVRNIYTTLGILILSPVVLMIFLSGALSLNVKIIASTLPFLVLSILFFMKFRKRVA